MLWSMLPVRMYTFIQQDADLGIAILLAKAKIAFTVRSTELGSINTCVDIPSLHQNRPIAALSCESESSRLLFL